MAANQVFVVLVTMAAAGLASGQAYNGYINPVFLPQGLRPGPLYDARDLPGGTYSGGRRLPLPLDYRFYDRRNQIPYDEYRRYQNPYDGDRRYQNPYDGDSRYNLYSEDRRYFSPYEDIRRYPAGLDRRYLYSEDARLPYGSRDGLTPTATPLDRGVGLGLGPVRGLEDVGQGFGIDRGFGLDSGLGLYRGVGIDRGLGVGRDLGMERNPGGDRGVVGLDTTQRTSVNRRQIPSEPSPTPSLSVASAKNGSN